MTPDEYDDWADSQTPNGKTKRQYRDVPESHVLRMIAIEEAPGIHTYHACDCGRGGCRVAMCATCWHELLAGRNG